MRSCIFLNVPNLVIGFQKLSRTQRTLSRFRNQFRSQFHGANGIDFESFSKVF